MPLTAQTPLSTSGPTPGRTLIQEGGNREQKTQLANSLKNIGSGRGLSNAVLVLIYGILICASGVVDWSATQTAILGELHAPVWWGACWRDRPDLHRAFSAEARRIESQRLKVFD
jgi:hypothetical protein